MVIAVACEMLNTPKDGHARKYWCNVLVLPKLSDGFGRVIAEALKRGKVASQLTAYRCVEVGATTSVAISTLLTTVMASWYKELPS